MNVVHHDLCWNNVISMPDNSMVLIDFEYATFCDPSGECLHSHDMKIPLRYYSSATCCGRDHNFYMYEILSG